jgi:addiction module RelE/StbE family toxin
LINYVAVFSKEFKRELHKLSPEDLKKVLKKVKVLENNPFYPSLRTRKMEGNSGYYESRVNNDIRLLWEFEGDKIILMADVGHHDVYKKY